MIFSKTHIRYIIIVVIGFIGFIPIKAQIRLGFRGGLSYSSLIQKIENSNESGGRMGFSIAGMADIPLNTKFSLRPELVLMNQGGFFYAVYEQMPLETVTYRCHYYTLQTPINVAYNIKLKDVQLGVFAGPTAAFPSRVTINDEKCGKRVFRNFDLRLQTGLFVEHCNFTFIIEAQSGLLNRYKKDYPSESQLYQNNVTFSLGYWFNINKK